MYIDVFRTLRARMLGQCPPVGTLEAYVGPVLSHLNSYFYESKSPHENGRIFGSYVRGTALPMQSAVDLLYVLPQSLFSYLDRNFAESDARLFELIQQIFKGSQWSVEKASTYDNFYVRNMQPYPVKIWPVIDRLANDYLLLSSLAKRNTETFNPFAIEKAYANEVIVSNGNLLFLSRSVRLWALENQVPLSGFMIDCFAFHFIANSLYRKFAQIYHDCLLRDFFNYLANIEPTQNSWQIPETQNFVYRNGLHFEKQAETAYHIMERLISNALIRKDDEVRKAMASLVGNEMIAT